MKNNKRLQMLSKTMSEEIAILEIYKGLLRMNVERVCLMLKK